MLKKLGILIFTLFLLVGCSFKNNVSSPKKERTPQEIMQIFKDNGYLLYESEYIVLLDLNRPNISFVYIDEYNGLFIPQRSMNSYNWIYDIAQIGKCGYYVDEKKVQSGECSKSDISEAINTKKFYLEELNAMSLTEEEVNALFKDIIDKKDSYKFDGIAKLDNQMGNVTESKSEVIPAEDTIKLKEPLILEINTNIEKPEYAISDSDYEKYNYIMDYLNKHLDKSEDVLFDELSDVYKESAESLKEFMNSVMQDAVDRDMGKTKNTVEVKHSDLENITTKFFVTNVVDESLFKLEKFDSSEINALNAIVKGTLSYDGIEHSFILKFKVGANLQNANIFQLKIDEKNIELK